MQWVMRGSVIEVEAKRLIVVAIDEVEGMPEVIRHDEDDVRALDLGTE